MATNVKRYSDAFDDVESTVPIVEDFHDETDDVFVNDDREKTYASDESDYEPSQIDDEEYGNESSESDDDIAEDKAIDHAVHLQMLNDRYRPALEECHAILKDKLNWVAHVPDNTRDRYVDRREFPYLKKPTQTGLPRPVSKRATKRFTTYTPISVPVNFAGPSHEPIEFKINRLCKYINEGEACPFGDGCKFTHVPKRPYCNKGAMCMNRQCTFFHPANETKHQRVRSNASDKEREPQRSRKIWFCRNIIQRGTCHAGTRCLYAHSKMEVADNVSMCKFGDGCRLVTQTRDGFVNNNPERKCVRKHKSETIEEFISRMQ